MRALPAGSPRVAGPARPPRGLRFGPDGHQRERKPSGLWGGRAPVEGHLPSDTETLAPEVAWLVLDPGCSGEQGRLSHFRPRRCAVVFVRARLYAVRVCMCAHV